LTKEDIQQLIQVITDAPSLFNPTSILALSRFCGRQCAEHDENDFYTQIYGK